MDTEVPNAGRFAAAAAAGDASAGCTSSSSSSSSSELPTRASVPPLWMQALASGKNKNKKETTEGKAKIDGAAVQERAEIEAARRELARCVASRIAFMKRKGYPCTVGKPKHHLTPSDTDPRVLLDPSRQRDTEIFSEIDRPCNKIALLVTEKHIWNGAMEYLKDKQMDPEYDLIPDSILLYLVNFDGHTWYHCNILGRKKDAATSVPRLFFVEVQCELNELKCARRTNYNVKACALLDDSESCYKCKACPPSSDILHPLKGGFACGIQEDQKIFYY